MILILFKYSQYQNKHSQTGNLTTHQWNKLSNQITKIHNLIKFCLLDQICTFSLQQNIKKSIARTLLNRPIMKKNCANKL